jgi:hypothetical protein
MVRRFTEPRAGSSFINLKKNGIRVPSMAATKILIMTENPSTIPK